MLEDILKIQDLASNTKFYEYDIYLKSKENQELKLKELSVGLNKFLIQIFHKGNKDLISNIKQINDLKPFRITFLENTDKENVYKFKLFINSNLSLNESFLEGISNYNEEIDLNYNKFKKHIIALSIFAEWTGLGKKTAFGMGNVKVDFLV
jgi:hypothetical protein